MQFSNTEMSAASRHQNAALWQQLLVSRPDAPAVLAFAQEWAERMENLRVQTGSPIWRIVDRSLRGLGPANGQVTYEQFIFALVALLRCWGYQAGLRRWAAEKGLAVHN